MNKLIRNTVIGLTASATAIGGLTVAEEVTDKVPVAEAGSWSQYMDCRSQGRQVRLVARARGKVLRNVNGTITTIYFPTNYYATQYYTLLVGQASVALNGDLIAANLDCVNW